jgi:hypothetical protein
MAVPKFNAKNFTEGTLVDNPYLTYEPNTVFTYEVRDGDDKLTETRTVTVTDTTKPIEIDGVTINCIVVIDEVRLAKNNKLVEVAYDYFAQDNSGNVWYFGEDVENYKNGKFVDNEGSWLAGQTVPSGEVAQPGIVMLAQPKEGVTYDQENAEGIAEDYATIIDLNASPDNITFDDLLKTEDINPLEKDPESGQLLATENKYYSNETGFNTEVYAETFELDPDSNEYELAETVELVSVTSDSTSQVVQAGFGATGGELLL